MPRIEVTIRLTSIEEHLRREYGSVRVLQPPETAVVRAFMDTMIGFIKDSWPVDTGTSRDSWSYRIVSDGEQVAVEVTNQMPYASYVHPAGTPEGEWYWQQLVTETWLETRAMLVARLKERITETEDRRRRLREGGESEIGIVRILQQTMGVLSA